MSTKLFAAALGVACVAAVTPAARAEMASPIVLANTCFSCHGTDGQSEGAMPSIKGKPAAYISAMLTAYRNDSKKGTVMNRIAKGFSPDEIAALSKYFASKQ